MKTPYIYDFEVEEATGERSKQQEGESASSLPDSYEAVLLRTYQLCPSCIKAQIRTLLRSDAALCARLKKTDDPSLIRITVAAAKRNGMVPGANAKKQKEETGVPLSRASNCDSWQGPPLGRVE